MALTKVTSGGLTDDSIVNADINSSAAIALSKLATDPSNASNLASGTVPDARFTTLPAVSGANLTALNASNLGSGTVPAARLSGVGKILQVQSTTTSIQYTTTSSSWQEIANPSVSITPSATSSKIWVLGSFGYAKDGSGYLYVSFQRAISGGATTTNIIGETAGGMTHTGQSNSEHMGSTFNWLDSPSTTSAITYKFNFRNYNNSNTVTFNDGVTAATLTVMEVGA